MVVTYNNVKIGGRLLSMTVDYSTDRHFKSALMVNNKNGEEVVMLTLSPELALSVSRDLFKFTEHARSPLYEWAQRKIGNRQ